ncbi:aromatic aminobenezylarsenical efflux permease ArsG family transporter [Acidobacteriota bacterium]
MSEFFLGMATALWLGILTSISPCPLATNIAAMTFVGRQVESSKRVLAAGLLYTFGRTLSYMVLGIFLVASLLSAPVVSHLLQKYMNKLLGPLLILVGMVLLDLIRITPKGSTISDSFQGRVKKMGLWGAGVLGLVFALSFCPVSAALFFGSLLPLAVKYESSILLPFLYGVGTALPVVFFAVLISLGARSIGTAFNKIATVEKWARRITGLAFILIGFYFTLAYIFRVFS